MTYEEFDSLSEEEKKEFSKDFSRINRIKEFFKGIWCWCFHMDFKSIEFYSNRTCKNKCNKCGHEWYSG